MPFGSPVTLSCERDFRCQGMSGHSLLAWGGANEGDPPTVQRVRAVVCEELVVDVVQLEPGMCNTVRNAAHHHAKVGAGLRNLQGWEGIVVDGCKHGRLLSRAAA